MKTKIITSEKPEFKPFTVEITVETIQEARLLFHLSNSCNIFEQMQKGGYVNSSECSTDVADEISGNLFHQITGAVELQGFKI